MKKCLKAHLKASLKENPFRRDDPYREIDLRCGATVETPYEEWFLNLLLEGGIYNEVADIQSQAWFYDDKTGQRRYRADFLIYTLDGRGLIFEIDGNHHITSWKQRTLDEEREADMSKIGLETHRIPNEWFHIDEEDILNYVKHFIKDRS